MSINDTRKVILFDLGRVLMHIDFDAFPNALGLFTKEHRSPYESEINRINRLYETGKISTSQFLDAAYFGFGKRFSFEEIHHAYDAIIVNDNQEIIPFVQTVREKYVIAILSNTSPSHWEKVIRISSVVKLFPYTFTSFQLGVMKPEKLIYEKVCTALNVTPGEVVFIDDLKENVNGAITAGMKGIVFQNTDSVNYLIEDEN